MKPFSKYFEHTLLRPDTTEAEVVKLFQEALKYDLYGVCVDGCYLPHAWDHLEGSGIMIATVIGFPLGTMATSSKAAETWEALDDGAEEVDAMINVGALKDGRYDYVGGEIALLAEMCHKENSEFKIILETCLLTEDEIVKACDLAKRAKVDFIKTSTGFSTGGATVEAVKLIRETVGDDVKIKASGGIRTLDQAIALIEA
ncbi:MAG: deoxyribose-phosphate aldolase, partial [Bacillota bacterium]|nr:deoxyribose-phosphate aldolase [Bacillota bacterium]